MKKALIIAYAKKNLGDDLFIYTLVNRYKSTRFYLCTKTKYDEECFKARNLKFLNPSVVKSINNLSKNLNRDELNCNNRLSKICDTTILIGGSMFMQNSDINICKEQAAERFSHLQNKYYILGSNFGPYKDEEYIKLYNEVFKKAENVCFREEYSYKLFEKLKNVNYASDIVFSMDTSNIKVINNKKVIISVIDLSFRKELTKYTDIYETKIKEVCEYFSKLNYEVILMSFCKFEGDEKVIDNIISKIDDKDKIRVYKYDGNIKDALNLIASSSIVIATRFHAMILGLLFGKTVIPIIYSKKTLNVINDIKFEGKYIKIKDMSNFDINNFDLNYTLDVSKQILDANRHFQLLDMDLHS